MKKKFRLMKQRAAQAGARITALREAMGLTRTQFAYSLGVTELTVWRWESGLAAPEGAAAALINAMEQRVQQSRPSQEDLGEAIGKVALGAFAGAALLALLGALFNEKK